MSAAAHSRCPSSIDAFSSRGIANAMTVDVEDYFQVEAFASTIERATPVSRAFSASVACMLRMSLIEWPLNRTASVSEL